MKKLIPLMLGMALVFGAVTTFASSSAKNPAATKASKAPKKKGSGSK